MVNAQEWLERKYLKNKREKVEKLNLKDSSLKGVLDLSDFVNLTELNISNSNIEKLGLTNCPNLKILYCSSSNLISLDVSKNPDLTSLNCSDISITELNLTNCPNLVEFNCFDSDLKKLDITVCKQLRILNCNNSNLKEIIFPSDSNELVELNIEKIDFSSRQDCGIFSHLANLEILNISGSRFFGSLEPLKNLNKLKRLDISDTDLSSGVEFLPISLEKIKFNGKVWERREWLDLFEGGNLKHWKALGFDWKEIKTWIKIGVKKDEYDLTNYLKNEKKLTPQKVKNSLIELRKDYEEHCSSKQIDQFIQENQEKVKVEEIPYEQFTYITYLAEGGFSKIYQAEWKDKLVILKNLNNSSNITPEFLREIASHKLFDGKSIIECHGISKDPEGNYVMVMDYARGGSLRDYLQKNNKKLDLKKKLIQLSSIAEGLKTIHNKGLVHKDFHLGNILSSGSEAYFADLKCFITDLGLCKPVSAENKDGEIFGVLPYLAPEVIQKKPYTQKSDVYSFGMVAYGVLSGQPPFSDKSYSTGLDMRILLRGERPQFSIKIPQLLEDLINRCWDANPEQRPTAEELNNTLNKWSEGRDTEFTQQLKEAEEFNKNLPDEIKYPKPKLHTGAVQHSKLINTKRIDQYLSSKQIEEVDIPEEEDNELKFQEIASKKEELITQLKRKKDEIKQLETQIKELEVQEASLQAQQEIPPK